jgi:hypothetical protein
MARRRKRKGPPCHESAGHRIIMQGESVDVRGRPVTNLRGTAQKCENVEQKERGRPKDGSAGHRKKMCRDV